MTTSAVISKLRLTKAEVSWLHKMVQGLIRDEIVSPKDLEKWHQLKAKLEREML